MVIFTDGLFPGPGALSHQQPSAGFLGAPGTVIPVGQRDSARQPSWLCQHHSVPSPLQGSWPCCPSCPPTSCSSTPISVRSSCLVSFQPLQLCWPCSQAPLCPPMGPSLGLPPICEPGLCASESISEWGSKFGTRETSFAFQSPPVSAGFLHSANEHCVFTHCMLCSLTCVL